MTTSTDTELVNRQSAHTHDSADPIPPPRMSPATPGDGDRTRREADSLASHSRSANAHPPALVPAYLLPPSLPRSAAELGHLQDHYHQNDDDQDPNDDPDNSSVHFASSIRVRTATSDPAVEHERVVDVEVRSCGKRVPYVGPIPLHRLLNHPKGGCITPLGRLGSACGSRREDAGHHRAG